MGRIMVGIRRIKGLPVPELFICRQATTLRDHPNDLIGFRHFDSTLVRQPFIRQNGLAEAAGIGLAVVVV